MPALKINAFGGELPAWSPKLLPDGQATASINGYMFTGELQGWRQPKFLRALQNGAAKFVYRVPNTTFDANGNAIFDTTITDTNQTFLEFGDIDTTVVRSQVINDAFQRFYVAAPSLGPPEYNTLTRIQANSPFFRLGIPQPADANGNVDNAAPVVTVSGGGSIASIGPTTSTGGTTTVNANVCYLLPIVPSGSSLIESLSVMPKATNANVNIQAVIFADAAVGGNAATTPGRLLGYSSVTTGMTDGTLITFDFSNPLAVNANTPYWIGIQMDTAETMAIGDGLATSAYFINTFSNGPPSNGPSSGVVFGVADLQMYVTINTQAVLETRSYVYTYVSAYGEEGPPSAPTLLTGWNNATWTITPTPPPSSYGGGVGLGNIAILRIYRTVPSSGGTTTYYQVVDISVGSSDPDAIAAVAADALGCIPPTTSYADVLPDNTVALNQQLSSTNYFPPVANLQQIVAMPNGMYAGWAGNTVYFCQPYLPHAWPPGYEFTVDAPIIGMAITNGSLVVVTVGAPWTFTGTNPSSMSQVRGSFPEPCAERGSIVGTDLGVFYKTINGLIQVNSTGQMSNYTETWITREKWNAETPPAGTRAIPLLGSYLAFGAAQSTGFTVELAVDNASFTIWPQPGGHRIGFNQLQGPNGNLPVTNVWLDPWTGIGVIIQNDGMYYYDFTNTPQVRQTYDWTSKTYQQNTKRSFEAFRVWFTNPNGLTPPPTRKTSFPSDPSWQTLSPNDWLYVLIYADVDDGNGDGAMQLIGARSILRSGEILRLPDGFKAENWAFRLIGRVPVSVMQVATSAKELANV